MIYTYNDFSEVAGTKKVLEIAKGNLQDNAVWFMRQAGRYLPEYESLKSGRPFLEFIRDAETVANVSLLPLRHFDVDSVVIFTDILLPLTKLGYLISYEDGISVREGRGDDFDYYSPLRGGLNIVAGKRSDKTIIGVVGGPFTTLSYVYDQGAKGYHRSKEIITAGETGVMKRLTEEIIEFARVQADSGADVIQIFESWIGGVSENYYENHLMESESYFVEKIREIGKPIIFFSEGASHLYHKLLKLKPDVYSIDWRMDLEEFARLCPDCVVQGNMDPYLLGAEDDYLIKETRRIMDSGRRFRGHIFNLGHGVPQWTDWKKIALITETVHDYER